MNPIKQFIEESEKKFDERFPMFDVDNDDYVVKDFLLSQHLALLNVVKGVIEGKKVTYKNENDEFFNSDRGIITNQIINEILKDLEIK